MIEKTFGVQHALASKRLFTDGAGESLDTVAEEYGVPRQDIEDAVRIATRIAA